MKLKKTLNRKQLKAIKHIVKNGNDKALMSKKWKEVKKELYRMGYLKRQIIEWIWVPTDKAFKLYGDKK